MIAIKKTILLVSILILPIGVLFGQSAKSYLDKGHNYYIDDDFNSAIRQYDLALNKDRNLCEAFYWRGMAYYMIKNYQKASTDLSKAYQLNCENPTEALYWAGLAFYTLKDYQKAVDNLKKAASDYTQRGSKGKAYTWLGFAYVYLDDYKNGAVALENALEYGSDNQADAEWFLGQCYYFNSEFQKAINMFEKAMVTSPSKWQSGTTYLYEGAAYYYMKEYRTALNKLNMARSLKYLPLSDIEKWEKLCNDELATNQNTVEEFLEPEIVITSPSTQTRGFKTIKEQSYVTEKEEIVVKGVVKDYYGISQLSVNNYRATVDASGNFTARIPLALGKNDIEIRALNIKNKSKIATLEIIRNLASGNYEPSSASVKKLALIVGNANYEGNGYLRNPINDARAMKTALESFGFDVLIYENTTQGNLKRAIDTFGQRLNNYDVGLFFYAGHGIQVDGMNYLVPLQASIANEQDVEYECVQMGRILGKMEAAKNKTNIIILDACRNNPFERSWSRSTQGSGLASLNAPVGSFIAYATAPGKTASDGDGQNGLYTAYLLKYMRQRGMQIEDVFKKVRISVMLDSHNSQTPWESSSLTDDFYFIK